MIDQALDFACRAIRALEEERGDISKDIADRFAELKAKGYDTGIVRQVLKRMRMRPDDRREADALLETYEAALGVASGDGAHVDMGPRRREPFTAPPNASTEEQLRAIISRVLEIRAERTEGTKLTALELRKARAAGFDPVKITEACQWLEKCDAHGRERMMAAEELYQIYREIGEGPAPDVLVEGDSALVKMFAGPAPEPKKAATLKQRQVSDAIALAQISRMNRGLN